MAAGEFGTTGKDGYMARKVATAIREVGKGGTQDRARGRRRNFCAKRIGLAGLEKEQHGREMELVVNGRTFRERWPLSLKRSARLSPRVLDLGKILKR